jgi:hypothetical protein
MKRTHSEVLVAEVPSANPSFNKGTGKDDMPSWDFLTEDGRHVRPCGDAAKSMRNRVAKLGFPCRVEWESDDSYAGGKDDQHAYSWLGYSPLSKVNAFPEEYRVTRVAVYGPQPD